MQEVNLGNKQVAKNMLFSVISFAINFGLSFFFTPYLIRTVGTEAYGFFPLTNNLIGYTSLITTAIGSMAGRFIIMEFYGGSIEKAKTYYNTVIVANLCLSALFTIFAIFGVIYLDYILNIPEAIVFDVKVLFLLTFLCLIVSLPTGILGIGLSVKNVNHLGSVVGVTSSLVRVGLMLLLFYFLKPSIIYIGIAGMASMIVGVCYGFYFKKKFFPEIHFEPIRYFDIKAVWVLITSGVWNTVNQLSNLLLQQLDLLITNIFISAVATGQLALAKTVPGLIYTILAMFSGAFSSKFNILYAQKRSDLLSHEIDKSIKIMSALMSIPIGLLFVFADVFFHLWVPSQDTYTLTLLSTITLLPMIFGASVNPVFGIFTITNKLKVPAIVLLIAGLIQTAIVFFLLKYTSLGIFAIPLVSAVQGGIRNFLFTPMYAAHCLGMKWYSMYKPVFRGGCGLIIVLLFSYLIKMAVEPDSWFLFLFSMGLAGTLSLLANMYFIFGETERAFVLKMAKQRLHV